MKSFVTTRSRTTFLFLWLLHGFVSTTQALTICITGSSQGIGLDAATRLLASGNKLIHACRTAERAQAAVDGAGGGIPMVCDLADFASIRTFAKQLQKEAPELDVLCLNAGMAPSTKATTPCLTKDGFEECVGVNHLGHFLLANLLQPQLANNKGRMIVTASSVHDPEAPGGDVGNDGGATLGDLSGLGIRLLDDESSNSLPTMVNGAVEYSGAKVYKDSKLANVLFCREALKRWSGEISIRSFNPGFIPSSGLFRAPRQDNWLGATAFTVVAGLVGFAVPISVGGERLAYMATASEKEIPTGSYFAADTKSKAATLADGFGPASVSKEASNEELAALLWERSLEICDC